MVFLTLKGSNWNVSERPTFCMPSLWRCWRKCCQLKILCMIENPRHNLFWFVTVWIVRTSNRVIPYLLSVIDDMNTSAGHCKTGKQTDLATSLGVHYLRPLCDAVQAFLLKLVKLKLQVNGSKPSLHHAAKALPGSQSICMKIPPLVPAYKHMYVVFFLHQQPVWPTAATIPADHKLLHEVVLGGTVSVEDREQRKKRILEESSVWEVDFS